MNNILTLALQRLEKAVTTGTIADIVPQDLEMEAHNTLWHASDPTELTLLKLCPSTPATSIIHEYDAVTAYGETRGFGFFGEQTLPRSTQPTFQRRTTNIKLIGEYSETFLLAALEKTIKVEGVTGAEQIAKQLLILSMLRKKARAMYFSDTSVTRSGITGQRFKGLIQQVREGTDGTVGTSPYGSHIIDMEGLPLTPETLRAKCAKLITVFGRMNCLLMDPFTRAHFEANLDAAQRLPLPRSDRSIMLGQNVGGFQTQGGTVFFHTDNLLSPLYAQGKYVASAEEGAPTSPPTVTATHNTTPTSPNVSKFNSGDGADMFWIITEIKNDREGLGRRIPASGTVTILPGEEEKFVITPSDPMSDSFKVYRGISGDADTDAYAMFEVANSAGGGAVTAYDLNLHRPGTGYALGLNIRTAASQFLHQAPTGERDQYSLAQENADKFFTMKDSPQNTVSMVNLGPAMGTMELATILPTVSRPLVYSACAMQVRNALQNMVFINVGSSELTG